MIWQRQPILEHGWALGEPLNRGGTLTSVSSVLCVVLFEFRTRFSTFGITLKLHKGMIIFNFTAFHNGSRSGVHLNAG